MRVFLTGASGLLGANIAHELVLRGHDLNVLLRPGSDERGIAGLPYTPFYGDLFQPEVLESALEGCDAAIHSAGLTDQWLIDFSPYEKVNVEGTISLVDAVLKAGVGRFIFVSTSNTIGNGSQESPGTEAKGFNLSHIQSGYISSKVRAERYVLEQVEKRGLCALVVNPAFLLGPYDLKPSSGRLIQYALRSRVQLIPPGSKNYLHVRDAAVAICNALTKGRPGERYLLAGENLSYRQFFDLINRVSGRKPMQIPLPGFVLLMLGSLSAFWVRYLGGKSRFNYGMAQLCTLKFYYSGQRAIKELGMPVTPLQEAVREALEWVG
jgi:dihydroflavonol-4-reductase